MTHSISLQAQQAALNTEQHQAVQHIDGPLLILAGAGSGKTRVLTMRIANLIVNHGVDPSRILAVTFTNKAATEMVERVTGLIGHKPPGMWIGTFHGMGARLLRLHADRVGRTSAFTIYDSDDSLSFLRRLMSQNGIVAGSLSPRAILSVISDAKNRLITVEQFSRLAQDFASRTVAEVYGLIEPELRRSNAAMFDDLLALPVKILDQNPEILARYAERFTHILVDEYQDTNHAQFRMISLLGQVHRNVCVVGDDDQSIYGWRGADIRNILEFDSEFPGARVVRLEDNYRSTPQILGVGNRVIEANTARRGKTLRATLPAGEKVSVVATFDERDEAEWIVDEIAARRTRDFGLEYRDCAVIYRTNSQSRVLEESLRRRAIPYRLVGSVRFYDRREVRDIVAYLKLIANPRDDEAFLRAIAVPKRGIGQTSLANLAVQAKEAGISLLDAASREDCLTQLRPAARNGLLSFSDTISRFIAIAPDFTVAALISEIVDSIGYSAFLEKEEVNSEERLDNIRELVASAEAWAEMEDQNTDVDAEVTPLESYLQQAALVADVDALDISADAVTLMTVHNAKGLEFPIVFISGLEDGLFPLAKAYDDPDLLEEERRLLYVGVTRAERKLYLSWAASRRRNGETRQSAPSAFLRDIPPEMIDSRSTIRRRSTARPSVTSSYSPSTRRTYPSSPSGFGIAEEDISQDQPLYVAGVRVKHGRFGAGTIADVTGVGKDAKVTVDFDDDMIGRKRLVVAHAGLQTGWDE